MYFQNCNLSIIFYVHCSYYIEIYLFPPVRETAESKMYIPFIKVLESVSGRVGKDRIVDIIKSLVHPEVGILDNPRVRRFRHTIEHIGAHYPQTLSMQTGL